MQLELFVVISGCGDFDFLIVSLFVLGRCKKIHPMFACVAPDRAVQLTLAARHTVAICFICAVCSDISGR